MHLYCVFNGSYAANIPVWNLRSMGHLAPQFNLHCFHNFFRCLIFDLSFFTNDDVLTIKDETSKLDHLKKIRETNRGQSKEQDIPLT